MMQHARQLKVFISHASRNKNICQTFATGLRQANVDVWYDEDDLGPGELTRTIEHELQICRVLLVMLSPAALESAWVERECRWFYTLCTQDPSRVLLPVVVEAVRKDDIWLFLRDFKRVGGPSGQPLPPELALSRTLYLLSLASSPIAPAHLSLDGDAINDRITQGKSLEAQQRPAEALPIYQSILNERTLTTAHMQAVISNGKGNTLLALAKYDEALQAYRDALSNDPALLAAWLGRGNALYFQRDFENALAAYTYVTQHDPTIGAAWNGRGVALLELKRLAEALAAFNEAICVDELDADAWEGKGTALTLLGRHEEALNAFERAISIDPIQSEAWCGLGRALSERGRLKEALTAYEHAVQLAPESLAALLGTGNTLVALGSPTEALDIFQMATDLAPESSAAWNGQGNAFYQLGKMQAALDAYDRAAELP